MCFGEFSAAFAKLLWPLVVIFTAYAKWEAGPIIVDSISSRSVNDIMTNTVTASKSLGHGGYSTNNAFLFPL